VLTLLSALPAAEEPRRSFNVPAGRAGETLKQFAAQAGREIVFAPEAIGAVPVRAVRGDYAPREALELMLAGSDLVVAQDARTGAFAVRKGAPDPNGAGPRAAPAKEAPPTPPARSPLDGERVVELSPFIVQTSGDVGYAATSTLAGTRIRTNLADLGSAISVVTQELMRDTGATNLGTLLAYTSNTEVGGDQGNFSGAQEVANSRYYQPDARTDPQLNTRIRGLGQADLTRGLNLTDIGFDAYNTDRVTVSRGPNSLLFGIGSPGGVIDASLKQAVPNRRFGEFALKVDNFGSVRSEFDFNQGVVKDRLALRVAGLDERQRYRQEEAWTRDRRFYGTLDAVLRRGAPGAMLGPTRLRANGEIGSVRESPVEIIPPTAALHGWFEPVPASLAQYTGTVPAANVMRPQDGGTWTFQATYNPLVATAENQIGTNVHPAVFRFITAVFSNPGTGVAGVGTGDGLQGYQGSITWSNARDTLASTGLAGTPAALAAFGPGAPATTRINTTTEYHANSPYSEPFAIGFAAPTLRNPAIFDYRRHIYSGGIDLVRRDFNARNLALEQGFFQQKLVLEAAYDRQTYESTRDFFFSGGRPSSTTGPYDIYVSIAEFLQDGQRNPNLGRAYTRVAHPEIKYRRMDRETYRLTAFGELDFSRRGGWLGRLGRHRLTGLLSDHRYDSLSRETSESWVSGDFDVAAAVQGPRLNDDRRGFTTMVFTSDSLLGLTSLDQVRLRPINLRRPQPGDSFRVAYADTSATNAPRVLRTGTVTMERYLNNESVARTEIRSRALAWQSYLLDQHLVGLLGFRRDDTLSYGRATVAEVGFDSRDQLGRWRPDFTRLSATPALDESGVTSTWSLVARYPRRFLPRLPAGLDLQVHYAAAENFNPVGARNDALGRSLAQPTGTTREHGLLVKALDEKVHLKVNWFRTALSAADAPPRVNTLAFAVNRVNDYRDAELNLRIPFADQLQSVSGAPAAFPVQTYAAFYAAMLNALPAALREAANLRQIDANRDGVWERMDFDGIPNLRSTQDRIARGAEVELVANPARGWRAVLNVSRQQTVNANTAVEMGRVVEEFTANLRTTRLGELRQSASGTTVLRPINELWLSQNLAPVRAATALDGTVSNEQREWRLTGVSSHEFHEGWLRGLGAGGAVRWESAVATGYRFAYDPRFGVPTPLVDQPLLSGSVLHGDLFCSYRARWSGRVRWKIQLNVRNAFGDDGDVPVKTNPDGQVAVIRIPNPRTFTLTNTVSF